MKSSFILFFFLLAILQYGVLLSAWSAYKSNYRPISLKYWSVALALSATSYVGFAIGLATSEDLLNNSNIIISVANTLVFGSVLFQGLFAKTLRGGISQTTIKLFIGIIISYGIIFELVRRFGSFESRTAIVGILLFAIYCWQILEIAKTRKIVKSANLNILFGIVLFESIFILSRAIVTHLADANVQVLSDVPVVVSLLLWIQLTLNILAYIVMVGYWFEEVTAKTVSAEYENTKIRILLEEKENLLNNLIKTKKIAELGAMSASISHEINQPLSSMKLNAWTLKKSHEQGATLSDFQSSLIDQMVKDNDRIAEIVSTLRSVFKDKTFKVTIASLYEFIDELKPLISSELGNRSIRVDYDIPTSMRIAFNENELTLVILNLINNAANAGAKNIFITADEILDFIELSIEDDGSGVKPEVLPLLFELGNAGGEGGLGLGLWLSKYIMERSGGDLEYTAVQPHGSIFTIKIPKH